MAERLVTAYCQMIFSDGIYHADPHPGNILVQPDGSLVFLDFGAVSKLSDDMREGILRFFEGVLKRDNNLISTALKQMGIYSPCMKIVSMLNSLSNNLLNISTAISLEQVTLDSWHLSDIKADLQTKLEVMADFSKMDISFRELTSTFQIPKDWVLLERTILLLLGLCTHLSPTMNPMKTIQPYLEGFVFGKDKDWVKLIESAVKDIALSIITIPTSTQNFLTKANQGKLELKVKRAD